MTQPILADMADIALIERVMSQLEQKAEKRASIYTTAWVFGCCVASIALGVFIGTQL